MAVKNNLKDIRFENKMNQTEFARMLGVNRQLYNRWENQEIQPGLEWVIKLSKRLGRPMEDIVFLDDAE
ncbi:helix-turn-helix transcriptional regulator [Paenibacillus senegalensis]|uniref:helix-turn-helix transcriptional regulator n=1 Tax=Paenibacillus senegalensis TaxID=1465766 RepID=UPI00028A171F|nr:helix-turn-helix domain-containing protein [Paenibacillus senegalensis]